MNQSKICSFSLQHLIFKRFYLEIICFSPPENFSISFYLKLCQTEGFILSKLKRFRTFDQGNFERQQSTPNLSFLPLGKFVCSWKKASSGLCAQVEEGLRVQNHFDISLFFALLFFIPFHVLADVCVYSERILACLIKCCGCCLSLVVRGNLKNVDADTCKIRVSHTLSLSVARLSFRTAGKPCSDW